MAVLHRALFTWFICLMFLILLALRLDKRVRWSWFIVFIPLWLYDTILLIYLVFSMISHCRNSRERFQKSIIRKIWNIFIVFQLIAAQILVALKLDDNGIDIPLFFVMIPCWVILSSSSIAVFQSLFEKWYYCIYNTYNTYCLYLSNILSESQIVILELYIKMTNSDNISGAKVVN